MLISYHTGQERLIKSEHLRVVGVCENLERQCLAVPLRIDPNAQNVFLSDVVRIPEGVTDSIYSESIVIDHNAEQLSVSLEHEGLAQWLSLSKAFYMAYSPRGLRLVRLEKPGQGGCVKQDVLATLVCKNGDVIVGTNRCLSPQPVCPRDKLGMKTGEGYHLCQDVCHQVSHAEVDAITLAGDRAKGGIIYLDGHSYACNNCQENSSKAKTDITVIDNQGTSFTFREELVCHRLD